MLNLYTTPLSANGRKVMAVSHELGLCPVIHLIDVYRGEGRTTEYLAINPSGKIPILVEDEFTLSESNAILIYLAEVHGAYRLWSRDAPARGKIAQWLFWESSQWQPALSACLAELVGHRLLPDKIAPPRSPPDWNNALLQPLLKILETTLSSQPFLTGENLTIADFSVAGMMTYFRAAKFPFHAYTAVSRWYGRIEALDSWRSTAAPLWNA
jgi:glutathione S-transferase